MLILAADTTGKATSLALVRDGEPVDIVHEVHDHPPSDKIFATLEERLKATGVRVQDVDAFACAIGPGSFTGIRIGLGMMKTFAFTLGKPIVGVDIVSTFAQRACFAHPNLGENFQAVRHGYKGTGFLGTFITADGRVVRTGELEFVESFEDLQAKRAHTTLPLVVEHGGPWTCDDALEFTHDEPSAVSVAMAAMNALESGQTPNFDSVQPLYLRPYGIGVRGKKPEDLR